MRIRDFVTGLSVAVLGFIGGIAATVYGIFKIAGKTDVLKDVALPGIKRTVVDTASAFISRAVFGSSKREKPYGTYNPDAKRYPKSTYYSYSKAPVYPRILDYDAAGFEVIFERESQAEELFDWVFHQLKCCGYLSVKELYKHVLPNSDVGDTYGDYINWSLHSTDDIRVEHNKLHLPAPAYTSGMA